MRVPFRLVFALILAAVVAGCGFQLRGTLTSNLPYKTLYIALPETSDVRIWLASAAQRRAWPARVNCRLSITCSA